MHHLFHSAHLRRVSIFAACCALALITGCSERRSEQKRGEGDIYLSKGDIAQARTAYTQAAETNPENPWAQLGLAGCAVKEGKTDEALPFYEAARKLDTNNVTKGAAFKEPVRILVTAKRTDEALAIAEAYKAVDPLQGGVLHGWVQLMSGNADAAVSELEALKEAYPGSSELELNLGVAYSQAKRYDEAIAILEPLTSANGSSDLSPEAQRALIDTYMAAGKMDDALAQYEKQIAASPVDIAVRLDYAHALLLANKPEEAESAARKILEMTTATEATPEIAPKVGWANYIVGAVKVSQGSLEEAVTYLETAASALPAEKSIATLLDQARSGKAPAEIVEAATTPTPIAATPAENLTWRDYWKQAALTRLVSNRDTYLAEGGNEVREVLVLAALFTQDVKLARELSAPLPAESRIGQFFKALDSRDPKAVSSLFEAWKPEEREETILRDNALGYAMVSGASRGQALSLFLFTLERWPDNVVALYNIAQVFRSVHQPIIAAQQFQRLISQYPDNIDAQQMLYKALREGGAFGPARKAAEASYSQYPEERWTALYLGQACLDTHDPEFALQVLTRASGVFPGDPELELARAGVFARLGDCAQVKTVLDAVASSAPAIIAGRANLLALCASQSGDWASVETAAQGVDPAFQPDSLRVLRCLAALHGGNVEGAIAALEVPGASQPAAGKLGLILKSALGVAVEGLSDEEQAWATTLGGDHDLLIAYGTTVALQMAQLFDASWRSYETLLASRAPHIALAQLAYAALQEADSIEKAGEKAQAVTDSLSGDPRAWIGLGAILKNEGDEEGEARCLEKAVAVGPESAEAWSKHASMLEKKQDYKGAAASFRKLVALQPDNAAAGNNLAYMLLMAGGSDEEALKIATASQEKMPNNPAMLHTLGLAQLRTGALEASKDTLGRAVEIDPANPTIAFDFGRVLLKLGDNEKAKERFRYALGISERAGLEFPERDEAEKLLADLN